MTNDEFRELLIRGCMKSTEQFAKDFELTPEEHRKSSEESAEYWYTEDPERREFIVKFFSKMGAL